MIDPRNEELIRLTDVPKLKWLPGGRGKKKLHISTVFRWAQRGRRGVRLETIEVSGAKCTTESALVRFFRGVTELADTPSDMAVSQRELDVMNRKLKESGYASKAS